MTIIETKRGNMYWICSTNAKKKKKSPIKNATHMNRLKNIQVIREAGKEFSKILYQLMIKLL